MSALATPLRVVQRDDAGYDQARLAWNLAADQRPAAVVTARSAAEVSAAVAWAAERGLRVAAQGTGHNAAHATLADTLRAQLHARGREDTAARAAVAESLRERGLPDDARAAAHVERTFTRE